MDWKKKVYGCQCLYGGTKCSIYQTIHGRNYLQNFGFQEWPASSEKCRVLLCPRYKPFKTRRRHTPVNLTLRHDIKVTCAVKMHMPAAARPYHGQLMLLINLGRYFSSLITLSQVGWSFLESGHLQWRRFGCTGRSES